ncbi:ATP-binding protein [Alkalilacustris brevis]|uniref:ATP-binding protein n=1 Tax=Alkalilacustris brevis TaxID=2026338 RepID=UPI0023680F33|nr:ATP-binding protein [Alkalilacustris brevis]
MCHRFLCQPLTVRATLECLMARLAPVILSQERAASTELVVAEVLNNVAEHAYAGAPGMVELRVCRIPDGLTFEVVDHGVPMPDGTPPLGRQVLHDVPLDQLPEGGFGWFLIRSLTRRLDYRREPGRNRLSFLIPLDPGMALP